MKLMKIAELTHLSKSGKVLMRKENIFNIVHISGEEFVLKVLFAGESIPPNYYMGLDSRNSPAASETMADIEGVEPSSAGYERQAVYAEDFDVALNSSGAWQANGPVVSFTAVGGSWGPIKNIFLCTDLDYEQSKLISTAAIGQNLIVQDGETITMRMAMSLSGC